MSILAWVSLMAGLSATPCALKPQDRIVVQGQDVTISGVMDVACLLPAQRDQAGSMVIARLPEHRSSIELTQGALKVLIHRRIPGLSFIPSPSDQHPIVLATDAPPRNVGIGLSCVRTLRDIGADRILSATDLERTSCEAQPQARAPLLFDRAHGVVRAARPLAAGENLGRLDAPSAAFDAGDTLTLSVNIGAIQVARQVVAVQAAPAGERIFVRDEDGAIFVAPTSTPRHQEDGQ